MLITAVVGLACNIVNIFTLHSWCGSAEVEEDDTQERREIEYKHEHKHDHKSKPNKIT